MVDDVTAALAAMKAEGTFATELACGSGDLQIEVAGVGPIRFPVSVATAQKLCKVARPAPFGRRDETLHDPSVRHTWEISKRQIKIDARRWRRTLEPQLAIVRQSLGLPEEGQLKAILDKMLVYEPGQFFALHQDSERADDMVGSLVVELPSTSSGGAVVIQHRAEKKVLRGAKGGAKDLSLLAFYADCHHEVKPIESGYRIVLTYHLLHQGTASDRAPAQLDAAAVDRLAGSVDAHFSTPVAISYSRSAPQRPDRLIYLLDHEYTQQSLAWNRLKNADRLRASALRQVAERLDCEIYLALADVHESWSSEGGDWGGGYGRRGRRGHMRDFNESGSPEDYELNDLLDTDVELRHWVDQDGRTAPGISTRPANQEVCFTTASVDMDPFKSEHEGYMGNYGNTVDRWYHRAAVVMWPRQRNFVIRAKMSPSWAVDELAARIAAGATKEARDQAHELLPFWAFSAPLEQSATFFSKLLTVLASLDDADLATGLLASLGPERLGPRATSAFITLLERHGLAWAQGVFSTWSRRTHHRTPPWLPLFPRFCETLVTGSGKHGRALATWLLTREVASWQGDHAAALRLPQVWLPKDGTSRRHDDLLALLDCAAVIQATAIRDDLLTFLTAPETALPLMSAGTLLQECREKRTPAAVRALGLHRLYRHVVDALERTLAAPERASDDWSMEPPAQCSCELCRELSAFLRDRSRIEYAWPLAKERRQHIHNVIDRHDFPVTHTTVRRGSPYTLVLQKQKALFEREAALRKRQKALLAWIGKHRAAFGEAAREKPGARRLAASPRRRAKG